MYFSCPFFDLPAPLVFHSGPRRKPSFFLEMYVGCHTKQTAGAMQ